MTQPYAMPIGPLRKAGIYPSLVGFRDDRIHEFISRFVCLALRVQSVAPVAIGGFAIRTDSDRFCEPDACAVEGVAAELRVGRVVSFLEFHVSREQGGLVKLRVKFKRTLIF